MLVKIGLSLSLRGHPGASGLHWPVKLPKMVMIWCLFRATKAYVQSFTCAIAYELRASNVKVCVICPGTTITGFHKRAGVRRFDSDNRAISMTAEEVAKIGYAGYKKGRSVVVTGMINRFFVIVSRLIPASWFSAAVARFNKRNL